MSGTAQLRMAPCDGDSGAERSGAHSKRVQLAVTATAVYVENSVRHSYTLNPSRRVRGRGRARSFLLIR